MAVGKGAQGPLALQAKLAGRHRGRVGKNARGHVAASRAVAARRVDERTGGVGAVGEKLAGARGSGGRGRGRFFGRGAGVLVVARSIGAVHAKLARNAGCGLG